MRDWITKHRFLLATLIALLAQPLGCAEDGARGDVVDGMTADATQTDLAAEETSETISVATSCPAERPRDDDDNDGLNNATEDANQDCVVDETETDPRLEDTDGDSLLDGDEDVNKNGRVDHGELDPRNIDSDGDGIIDGNEPLSRVCRASVLSEYTVQDAADHSLLTNVLKPALGSEGELLLEAENGLVSGLVWHLASEQTLSDIARETVSKLGAKANSTALIRAEDFRIPGIAEAEPPLSARQAVRVVVSIGWENQLNPQLVRDMLLESFGGKASGATTENICRRFRVGLTIARGDGLTSVTAAVACEQQLLADGNARTVFDELLSGSQISHRTDVQPSGFTCAQSLAADTVDKLDILVVVDNKSDARTRQERLASGLVSSLELLDKAGVDWRLGVTTGEAYLALSGNASKVVDPLLDACSGLRWPGVIGKDDTQHLEALLLTNPECELGLDTLGVNLCGIKEQSPLSSGVLVLEEWRESPQECEAANSFRQSAQKLVIWLLEDEDQLFINGPAPLNEDSTLRAELFDDLVSRYDSLGVTGCALTRNGMEQRCGNEKNPQPPSRTAIDLARSLSGVYGSSCAADYSALLESCMMRALPDFGVPVDNLAVPGTFAVAVNAEGTLDPLAYRYDPVFRRLIPLVAPLPGQKLGISYLTWVDAE